MNDIETFEITALNNDISVVCDGTDENNMDCKNPAENILRMCCCGFALLMCDECTKFIFDWFSRYKDTLHSYTCAHCNIQLVDNTNVVLLVGNI